MKKVIHLVASAALIAPLLVIGVVSAQTTQTPTQTTTTEKRELTAEQKAEMQLRVEKRKAEMKVKITAAEKQRLQSRCKNSQGSLSSIEGRIKGIETSRAQVYDNLVTRLTSLSDKLEAKNIDTTDLDAQIVALEERIVTFATDLEVYKVAVADLAAMDCATNPEGFKASLETARAAREKVSLDVAGIRKYVADTIKPTIKTIREKVAASSTEETQ